MTQPSSESKVRILIVDDVSETRENIAKLLFFERDMEVVGSVGTAREALEACRKLKPDVVLMDINMPEIDGITATQMIAAEMPGASVIMMSVQGEADYLRRSMLAGAREFLVKPFGGDELISSIRHVYELDESRRRAMGAPQLPLAAAGGGPGDELGKVICVFSPKGGSGCTTIATNLALAMRELTGKQVALVDCSLLFGDVAVMLNLLATKTISDLVSRINELDAQLLDDVMITHASGLRVLLAPPRPQMAELITPDHVRAVLEQLRRSYDYVVVDTWPSFQDVVLSVMDVADTIMVVMTLEMPAIKNVKLYLEVVELLGYPTEKIMLVLNKMDARLGIKTEIVEESLKQKVARTIPADPRAVTMAINQGVPLIISARDSAFAQAVHEVAAELTGGLELVAVGENGHAPASRLKWLKRAFH